KLMQVTQDITELRADVEYLLERQRCKLHLLKILVKRLAIDEVHHQIPVSFVDEMLVDGGQMWMIEAGKQTEFAVEGIGSLDGLRGAEGIQFDGLDRYHATIGLKIARLV